MIPTVNDAEGTDLTIYVDMEEGVDLKQNKNDIIEEGKSEGETTDSVSTTVNNEELGGNVDLEAFNDIYGDLDEHITEDSIFWVNTKKNNLGR